MEQQLNDARCAGPAQSPLRYRIEESHRETHDVRTLRLVPVDQAIDRFRAGQFALVDVAGAGELPVPISGGPLGHGRELTLTVRSAGPVSDALCQAPVGTVVGVRGPLGTSWDITDAVGEDLLFVGDGIGLAALHSALLEAMTVRGCFRRVSVVFGATSPAELIFTTEFEDWRAKDVMVLPTVDRVPMNPCTMAVPPWSGRVGPVSDLLPELGIRPEHTVAYVCGTEPMMVRTGAVLTALGVPPERIKLSVERNMRCDTDTCGPDLVCHGGPVTTLDDAALLCAADGCC